MATEAKSLSFIPKGLAKDDLHQKISLDKFKELRASLESKPNIEQDLRLEAKMNLQKVLPLLNEKGYSDSPSQQWGVRPGHIAFSKESGRLINLQKLVNEFFDFESVQAGDFLYPKNGFRLWHTNKYDQEGWFVFFVDVDRPQQSFFRFVDPETNEIVTQWDKPLTMNIFRIDKKDLFWHCIGSNQANRWSQGFSLPNDWKQKMNIT